MHRRPEAELLPLDTELERTLRNLKNVIVAKAIEEESLYNAWERYKKFLKRCPMHGID